MGGVMMTITGLDSFPAVSTKILDTKIVLLVFLEKVWGLKQLWPLLFSLENLICNHKTC